jgi:hypothetical protein
MRLKQRIVRILVHEIVADVDEKASEIVLLIHWTGGQNSELRIKKKSTLLLKQNERRRSFCFNSKARSQIIAGRCSIRGAATPWRVSNRAARCRLKF